MTTHSGPLSVTSTSAVKIQPLSINSNTQMIVVLSVLMGVLSLAGSQNPHVRPGFVMTFYLIVAKEESLVTKGLNQNSCLERVSTTHYLASSLVLFLHNLQHGLTLLEK
ncbi:hypothetical protein VNO78_17930 [Psophocarpus tetragonolobus]|uniref:Uncharacterized protein n=1 Tax=Psophocarpus tetragonolobus TaxID=3891 RepID=A0AAN9SIJ1_PSOTE